MSNTANFYEPEVYDARAQGVPGDIEFFLGLAKEADAAGHPVLELATGTGRIAIPIARAGVRVVGLDLSEAMLAQAAEKSSELENVRWVRGEMKSFDLQEKFGLVCIPFRSFQHLLTVADQIACLECIHRHLVPGGRLALNIFNPDIVVMGQWLGAKLGGVQRRRDDYVNPKTERVVKAWETRAYHTGSQELEATFIDEELDDGGVVVSKVYRGLRLRYLFRYEMEHLLARCGFEIEDLFGDCVGTPFGDTSPEMVFVARRPA
ncbi:MAG: class I SAM-dependent methyltransferase [Chloroflexi bacterium]|nr:class I SAM-dependent methyltransferase [Chloroflexota bacterium]MCI0889177.1 class I SAM-dependent methyltransferase [Chloroflexota bacterium]